MYNVIWRAFIERSNCCISIIFLFIKHKLTFGVDIFLQIQSFHFNCSVDFIDLELSFNIELTVLGRQAKSYSTRDTFHSKEHSMTYSFRNALRLMRCAGMIYNWIALNTSSQRVAMHSAPSETNCGICIHIPFLDLYSGILALPSFCSLNQLN